MASFLRRQDDLQNLKARRFYLQNTNGIYPADESILTISGDRGLVVTSSSITVNSLATCELTAADGKFVVNCTNGWLDMYAPGPTVVGLGSGAASGIQLHGGVVGGSTTSQYQLRTYIQNQGSDGITGAGVTAYAVTGNIGLANPPPSGTFLAPMIQFDGSANKMRVLQYATPVGNIASVTIDQNYSPNLEPPPLNQAQHCGRLSTQQIQVGGYMGVNIYNNDDGFQPLQPIGITSQFGGVGLRNSPIAVGPGTTVFPPYTGSATTNRYPTVITAWKPTAGTTISKTFNLITMDVSEGFIGILKNNPAYTLDVFGNINASGNITGASKAFNITHPLDAEKRLVFTSIEGPRCDLLYRGRATLTGGTATISLDTDATANGIGMMPGTFSALARNPQVYLQNNITFDRVIGTVQDNTLTIQSEAADSTATIDWMVVAERKDAAMYDNNLTNVDGYLVNEHPAL